jgi:hypothetical protein
MQNVQNLQIEFFAPRDCSPTFDPHQNLKNLSDVPCERLKTIGRLQNAQIVQI